MKTENPILILSVTALTDVTKNLIANVGGGLANATDVPLGVFNADTLATEQAPVMVNGVALVVSGDIITAGDLVKSDANAKAIATTTNDKFVFGKALDSSVVAGDIIRVLLN